MIGNCDSIVELIKKKYIFVLTCSLEVVRCYPLQVRALRHASYEGLAKDSNAQVKRDQLLTSGSLEPPVISNFKFIFPHSLVTPYLQFSWIPPCSVTTLNGLATFGH